MELKVQPNNEYHAGYISCEVGLSFDEAQCEEWKKGYLDKERERLVRSVKYHLDYVSGKTDCCYELMAINSDNAGGTEYQCYYYGKNFGCKCYNKMLQDFLRLYVN